MPYNVGMYHTIPLTPLVLDVDTGEDDALALLLAVALQRPMLTVLTSYGNTTLANATANTASVLELAGATHIPVIQGAAAPLLPHPHAAAQAGAGDFVGQNGLCDVVLPAATHMTVLRPAPDVLAQTVRQCIGGQRVSYVVTGPCTNLALLIAQLGDQIHAWIDHVYIMAGALDSAGNSGPYTADGVQLAEFNVYCDAVAFARVLASGLPITMVSWDATQHITIPYADVMRMHADSAGGAFVVQLMRAFLERYGLAHQRNFELNDPMTVLAALGLGRYQRRQIAVSQHPDSYGCTRDALGGAPVRFFEPLTPAEHDWYVQATLHGLGVHLR
jgi:inosine-uridine nucleoside N-ribohydrolase